MTEVIRTKMLAKMNETITEESQFHCWSYVAVRPMPVPRSWVRGQKKRGDCSKGCQYIALWSGAPDPMGRNWDAYGNSTTMTIHLKHYDHLGELQVGDYVTFGPNGDEHAATVMKLIKNSEGTTTDVILWSFGHQGAPNEYRLSFDKRQRYFLHNPVAAIPLTPAEQLRQRTGFWSWVQWRKGTGHWHGWGPGNKKVRPNVPRRIPISWWKRYIGIWGKRNAPNPSTT